ncbi:hypothetical protein [Sphingomonas sp. SRS2]|uniref:hypothetical protein n=1 Tax=Sphingomonas sp. SRS2 TaxID=133190 RepID=UPI0006184B32|nr:hypothetical protein [Sphingomonas sp. SRS2]KKC27315.1 hypothetical protein WP12_03985 [Sphingomonas sp. SRS2]
MSKRSCETCFWWDQAGAALAAGSIDPQAQPDLGACCVDPPQLKPIGPYWHVGIFPLTSATRFCGEWQPAGEGGDGGEEEPVSEPTVTNNILTFGRSAA